jgi:hypothetical protein
MHSDGLSQRSHSLVHRISLNIHQVGKKFVMNDTDLTYTETAHELHNHTSRQKTPQKLMRITRTDRCAPPEEAISFKNDYPTTEELVCSAVSEKYV